MRFVLQVVSCFSGQCQCKGALSALYLLALVCIVDVSCLSTSIWRPCNALWHETLVQKGTCQQHGQYARALEWSKACRHVWAACGGVDVDFKNAKRPSFKQELLRVHVAHDPELRSGYLLLDRNLVTRFCRWPVSLMTWLKI